MHSDVYRPEARASCDILVFDGEPVILDLLTAVLDRQGYRVTPTPLWEEAVQLVSTRSYGLAIADLDLRRKDGCRLVTALKRVSPGIPIVAMTAYPAEEIVAFAEKHVEAFLVKPFGMDELLKVVRAALNGGVPSHMNGMSSLAPRQQSAPVLAASG